MIPLDIFVPGLPRPQGSMRAVPVGQHVRLIDGGGNNLAIWRSAITESALRHWDAPILDEPMVVVVDFYLPRPRSAPKRRHHPDRKPDIDKLCRAILDSLTGVVFTDDARVVSLRATKLFAVDRYPVGARILCGPVVDASVPGPRSEGKTGAHPAGRPPRLASDNPARVGRERSPEGASWDAS